MVLARDGTAYLGATADLVRVRARGGPRSSCRSLTQAALTSPALLPAGVDAMWVGTKEGLLHAQLTEGAAHIDGRWREADGLLDDETTSLAYDVDGALIVGTRRGADAHGGHPPSPLGAPRRRPPRLRCVTFTSTATGTVWLATYGEGPRPRRAPRQAT